ncbi:MAG: mannitol dehydrogenase family protein [Clostridia bacterium]|nr:mannitol dehydrogenase family protein [Clostridia bacterium]
MKLTKNDIKNETFWRSKGYILPDFDYDQVKQNTSDRPFWIHFGTGNIFRAFQAHTVQKLLNDRVIDCGLIAVGGSNSSIITDLYQPHDNLSILVTLKASGELDKEVIGSIMESYVCDSSSSDYEHLKDIFSKDSLQMVTYTITEKGYSLRTPDGNWKPEVTLDFENGPAAPKNYMGIAAALLYHRFQTGARPIAMVSMDNCSHNGDVLKESILTFAKEWRKKNFVPAGFVDYLSSSDKVSYPWTMIDKITPHPDPAIGEMLANDGLEDFVIASTNHGMHAAPYVNAEECEYLVIEDSFPNGRPPLEKGGFLFADKSTVEKTERMKVCTCLNPLHTALAIFGCLLGYTRMSEEMKDPLLLGLAEGIGYTEGLPVVTDPGILSPRQFLDEVVKLRVPNPFLPDTPQRIAIDTSQKLPIRFGETIKAYLCDEENGIEKVKTLRFIPFVYAGWLRYLMGIDDAGNTFMLSPDPLLETVTPYVSRYHLGDSLSDETLLNDLTPLLSNKTIWGVDLIQTGLAPKVITDFQKLILGPGAIKSSLEDLLKI